MQSQLRGILQLIFLIAFVILLIRFFPFVVRIGEAAAIGLLQFWWVVLILALGGWLVWVLRKRNSD